MEVKSVYYDGQIKKGEVLKMIAAEHLKYKKLLS